MSFASCASPIDTDDRDFGAVAGEFLQGKPLPSMARWHHEREEMVRASGIPATFLRPGGFMTNALDWLPTLKEGGYVIDPTGPDVVGFRTSTLERLLGRRPRTFSDWCMRNASAFGPTIVTKK